MISKIIKKIIEWDKHRKFGHKFSDFILLLCVGAIINILITAITQDINELYVFITAMICVLLWSRKAPDDES